MDLRERKKILTKDAIDHSFWELFSASPIFNITVKQIVDKANISRSTFYSYFNDVFGIMEEKEEEILNALDFHFFSDPVDKQGLGRQKSFRNESMIKWLNICLRYKREMSILLSPNGDKQFEYKLSKILRNNIMHRVIYVDKQSEKLGGVLDYYVQYQTGGIIWTLREWLCADDAVSIEDIAKVIQAIPLNWHISRVYAEELTRHNCSNEGRCDS